MIVMTHPEKHMETLVVRITPAWKRELEIMKAENASRGSIVSLSEIVRQQLSPWMQARTEVRAEADASAASMSANLETPAATAAPHQQPSPRNPAPGAPLAPSPADTEQSHAVL